MSCENKPLIEVICNDRGHWPSFYMQAAVQDVLPAYAERVDFRVVNIREPKGKHRLLELSCALYGIKTVNQLKRFAPVPSLFIDGRLVFDAIPDRDELKSAIDGSIRSGGIA
jgi:hypothetical protein